MGTILKYFDSNSLYALGFQPAASGPKVYYATRGHSLQIVYEL